MYRLTFLLDSIIHPFPYPVTAIPNWRMAVEDVVVFDVNAVDLTGSPKKVGQIMEARPPRQLRKENGSHELLTITIKVVWWSLGLCTCCTSGVYKSLQLTT